MEKYKIGEAEKVNDPETKAPAVKNPYFQAKPGVLRNDNAAIDKLLARGTVFGACAVALRGHARRLAKNANVTPDEAAKEFAANIIPGITVIPSGVWGVNRPKRPAAPIAPAVNFSARAASAIGTRDRLIGAQENWWVIHIWHEQDVARRCLRLRAYHRRKPRKPSCLCSPATSDGGRLSASSSSLC